MIIKETFIDFLRAFFQGNKIDEQHFDSGCSMIDIYSGEGRLLCIQLEPKQIGVSIIENYQDTMDLSTLPDNVFYSNEEAEVFVRGI